MKWKLKRQKKDNVIHMPLWTSVRHRLPWLLFGLFGGLLAAQIVGAFGDLLKKKILLASFIPLIAYMNGAIGAQMGAFVIRDFAVNNKINVSKYILRQFRVVVVLGFIVCGLLWVTIRFVYGDLIVAMAVSVALYVAMITSVFTGTLIPLAFEVFDLDPANGSGAG